MRGIIFNAGKLTTYSYRGTHMFDDVFHMEASDVTMQPHHLHHVQPTSNGSKRFRWYQFSFGAAGAITFVGLPLWLPAIVFAILPLWYGVVLLQRSRRRIPGTCLSCSYDLTGNVSGRCPECGTPTRSFAQASIR